MANWAYVENGQVKEAYDILPDCWRNVSNFSALQSDVNFLRTLNWVPIRHETQEIDPTRQQRVNCRYQVDGLDVLEQWDVVDLPLPEPPSREAIERMLISETQGKLDRFAQSRGYDSILAACSYGVDPDPTYQSEGQYCVAARSATWIALYQIINEIREGHRAQPQNYSDVEQFLPALNWPDKDVSEETINSTT